MTREEIREGIAEWLWENRAGETTVQDCVYTWAELPGYRKDDFRASADKLLTYEHSQGVVIKVDRELPENPNRARNISIDEHPEKTWDVAHSVGWRDGWESGRDDTIDAGYVAVEPLIEEK